MASHGSALAHLRALLEMETSDSIRLLENIKDNPICSINFDPSVACVSVRWGRYATSTQLRFIHEVVIYMLERHAVRKVLGDDTPLPMIHEDDQKWIVEDWLPRAIQAGLRFGASKKPVSDFGRVSVDKI